MALMTLFAHIISDPSSPTATEDTALMEVVTGLFGHLKFLSSDLQFLDQAKEFVRLAQLAVQNTKPGATGATLFPKSGHRSPVGRLTSGSNLLSSTTNGEPEERTQAPMGFTPNSMAWHEYFEFDGHMTPGADRLRTMQAHDVQPMSFSWGTSWNHNVNTDHSNGLENEFHMDLGVSGIDSNI
jgi:hypothetical protein